MVRVMQRIAMLGIFKHVLQALFAIVAGPKVYLLILIAISVLEVCEIGSAIARPLIDVGGVGASPLEIVLNKFVRGHFFVVVEVKTGLRSVLAHLLHGLAAQVLLHIVDGLDVSVAHEVVPDVVALAFRMWYELRLGALVRLQG